MYSTPVFKGGRGDRQMRQKARGSTLIGIVTSSNRGYWPSISYFYHDGRWEEQLMLPDLSGAAQLCASGNPAASIRHL